MLSKWVILPLIDSIRRFFTSRRFRRRLDRAFCDNLYKFVPGESQNFLPKFLTCVSQRN